MASQNSFLFFEHYYKNNNGGLEASIPNMNSTNMVQQHDSSSSSSFNMPSYEPPCIQNQQLFSGLELSNNSFISNEFYTRELEPSIPNMGSYGLMPFPNDLPSQMGGVQTFSPLNIASSSSFTWASYTTNYHGFNEFVPPSNEIMPSQMGFMQATRGLTEIENLNGFMPIPSNMPFEESFAQRSSCQNEPEQNFSGLKPFQIDMPLTGEMVDYTRVERDADFKDFDQEHIDFEERNKSFSELKPFEIDMSSTKETVDFTHTDKDEDLTDFDFELMDMEELQKNLDELVPVTNDIASEEGFAQRSSCPNEADIFSGLEPFKIDMPSTREMFDFTVFDLEIMDMEVSQKNVDELMPITINMASGEGFAQRSSSPNELESLSTGSKLVQNDIPSTSERMDFTDTEEMTKLERDEEQPQPEGAVTIYASEAPFHGLTLQTVGNGVYWTFAEQSRPSDNCMPFGKNGLKLVKIPYNRPLKIPRLTKSRRVETYDANFEISESRVNLTGMTDKLEERSERLKGWTIEIRVRHCGIYEKFYHHNNTKKIFRSIPEVEKFIFYEVYPPKPKKNPNQLLLCNEPHNPE